MVDVIGIDDKYVYQVTHDKCGHILKYTEFEVIETTYTDYGGSTDSYDFIICPVCSKLTNVTPSRYHSWNAEQRRLIQNAKVEVTNRKKR